MPVEGLYLSRYQGKITAEAVDLMVAKKVGFVGLRLTSGSGYVDPTWEHNAAMLRDTGILLFPWHFVTRDEASRQSANFMEQIKKFDRWRLPPALDCEGFTAAGPFVLRSASEMQMYPDIFSLAEQKVVISPDGDTIGRYSAYSLTFPVEATIDAMGRWLTTWMASQPELAKYVYPAIYSACWCEKIFKTATMKRYLGWWASWGVDTPCIPSVWRGVPHYIHQDAIVDGAPYGIVGQVSHEVWGPLFPFPGDEPEPPPEQDYIDLTGVGSDGSKWSGRIVEE